MAITDITDTIKVISGYNKYFDWLHCNSLWIDDERKVLIDTSAGEGLRELDPAALDVVICSHAHADHFNYNFLFPGVPVWMPEGDGCYYQDRRRFYAPAGWEAVGLDEAERAAEMFGFREGQADREYADGEVLDFGHTRLTALKTPGHWPNHMVFWEESERFLFSTDIDLTPWGPWYGCVASSLEDMAASIRRLIALGPRTVVTSHLNEVVTENVEERLQEYLAIIDRRDEQILCLIRGGKTLAEVVDQRPFYRRYPEPAAIHMAFQVNMTRRHLERLVQNGRACSRNGHYFPV